MMIIKSDYTIRKAERFVKESLLVKDTSRVSTINDDRLTSGMVAMDCLSEGVGFSNGSTILVLDPPSINLYPVLVESNWYWVNLCSKCEGNDDIKSINGARCAEHDNCDECGMERSGSEWSNVESFNSLDRHTCPSCDKARRDKRQAERKAAIEKKKAQRQTLLDKINNGHEAEDFKDTDTPSCPYCKASLPLTPEELDPSLQGQPQKTTCTICKFESDVILNVRYIWTTKRNIKGIVK
ncbi:hypothetical protein VCHA53O466_50361 [Vibrio chagasii]|nr:hypothetical protein VCHA53O466_50361 [Vibrio chagasii]